MQKTILTGITASGTPHIGNYVGAIKPAIELSKQKNVQACYFIADYHSLVKLWDAKLRKQYTREIAASFLALGFDYENCLFYRQSDIPEILELNWILTSITAKGLLNRSHAYKAVVQENIDSNKKDQDAGINMGLFSYPMLMTADILAFNAHQVPVGKDQLQHMEIARDIANRFNHVYGNNFIVPEAIIDQKVMTLPGLDGRKMSKSYGNAIPLFAPEKKLRKLIMKIKTNSQLPEEPKTTEGCSLFQIYQAFATEAEVEKLRNAYATGIGWGEIKQTLFECINSHITEARDKYNELIDKPGEIDEILQAGALKARKIALPILQKTKELIGIN